MYEPTKNPVGWTGNGFELVSIATRSAEKIVHYEKDMYSQWFTYLRVSYFRPYPSRCMVRTCASCEGSPKNKDGS